MKKPRRPYSQWKAITTKICQFEGWTEDEMKKYYEDGLSPLEAMELAAKRRLKEPT